MKAERMKQNESPSKPVKHDMGDPRSVMALREAMRKKRE